MADEVGTGASAGTATAQPEGAESPTSTPEQQPTGTATAQPDKTPSAPQMGDAEIVEAAKEKLRKDRGYKLSQEEADAYRNVQKGKPRPGTPKAEATPAPEPKPESQPTPEVPAPLKAVMDRLKVQKVEDLPASIEKMQADFQKLNGERGNLGPLQERLTTAQSTLETQHAIIRDLVLGEPRALEWAKQNAKQLGIDPAKFQQGKPAEQPAAAQGNQAFNPDMFLDPDLAKFANQKYASLEAQLKQAMDRIEALSQNTEKYGKFYETELERQARESSLAGAKEMVQNLIDTEGVSGLYDRRHGPIGQHLDAFFKNPSGEVPAPVKNVVEVLRIANSHKLDNLQHAYFIWQGMNRGTQAVAAARAAQAPHDAKPTVGLSDRQEGNGRVPTGPTVQDVMDWKDGKKPIPREFIKNGRFNAAAIDPEVMAEVKRRGGK